MSQRVAVVGAGLMGSGIAQVAAQAGWQVVLRDVHRRCAPARDRRNREEHRAPGREESALGRRPRRHTGPHHDDSGLGPAAEADIVVEAVFEQVEIKQELFRELDRICRADAVLATNISAIPITTIASATTRPESVVGTHFFSPVPVMNLCRGFYTYS